MSNKNPYLVKRVAAGEFTFPPNTSANTASTLSALVGGAYIPSGAIVTGVRLFAPAAVTHIASLKNATINLQVSNQVLLSNDVVGSVQITQTVAAAPAGLSATNGVYVPAGGPLKINIGLSDATRTGIAGSAKVFVDYIVVN